MHLLIQLSTGELLMALFHRALVVLARSVSDEVILFNSDGTTRLDQVILMHGPCQLIGSINRPIKDYHGSTPPSPTILPTESSLSPSTTFFNR